MEDLIFSATRHEGFWAHIGEFILRFISTFGLNNTLLSTFGPSSARPVGR